MSAPKPCETNPTPTHSSRPALPLQFSVRSQSLKYSREKSFYLTYGKHWSRRLQNARTRSVEGNTYMHKLYFISNFRITVRANVFETLHLQLKYT